MRSANGRRIALFCPVLFLAVKTEGIGKGLLWLGSAKLWIRGAPWVLGRCWLCSTGFVQWSSRRPRERRAEKTAALLGLAVRCGFNVVYCFCFRNRWLHPSCVGVPFCFCTKLRHPQKGTRQMFLATILLLKANCSLRKKTVTSRRKAYVHWDARIQIYSWLWTKFTERITLRQ